MQQINNKLILFLKKEDKTTTIKDKTGQHARVTGLWLKPAHHAAMKAVKTARMIKMRGLEGNINQGGKRQVTLIEAEVWRWLMTEMQADLPPQTRRANIMLTHVPLKNSKGKILQIGPCKIRIMGETKPCRQMEQALPGLKELMFDAWRGGAYGQIIEGGIISLNDSVQWIENENTAEL